MNRSELIATLTDRAEVTRKDADADGGTLDNPPPSFFATWTIRRSAACRSHAAHPSPLPAL